MAFVIGAGALAGALGAVADLPQRIGRLFADEPTGPTRSLAELDAELLTAATPLSAFRASPSGPLVARQPTTGPLGSLALIVAAEPETTADDGADETDGREPDTDTDDSDRTDGTDTDGTDTDGTDTDGTDTDGTDGEETDGTGRGDGGTDGDGTDGDGTDSTGSPEVAMQRALDAWQAPAIPPVRTDDVPARPGATLHMGTRMPEGADGTVDVVAPELDRQLGGCDGHCLDAVAAIVVAAAVEDGTGDPDAIVRRFEERLGRVRSIDFEGRREPIGAVVQVDIRVIGHRERDLLLSYMLHPVDGLGTDPLPEWFHAYRLRPTADEDQATVNVWVPLPAVPGPYLAQLAVFDPQVPERASLAAAKTEPFGE